MRGWVGIQDPWLYVCVSIITNSSRFLLVNENTLAKHINLTSKSTFANEGTHYPTMTMLSNLLIAMCAVLFIGSNSASAGLACFGNFFGVVNGNDNHIPLTEGCQLCSGVPINIWFDPDEFSVGFDGNNNVGLTLTGDETLPLRCENVAPYALFGDSPKANFIMRAFAAGSYNVNAVCGCQNAIADPAHSVDFSFEVVDCPDPALA